MSARGVSLVELVVAVALFGVLLLGAAGAGAEALRRTRTEARRGHALNATLTIADSLAVEAAPGPGQRLVNGSTVTWTVHGEGDLLRVRLRAHPAGDTLAAVRLELLVSGSR